MWHCRAEARTRYVYSGLRVLISFLSDNTLAFIKQLEAHGWDADTQVEYPSLTMGQPLEDLNVTPEERSETIAEQLKQSADSKRALIVKVSHVGGHKYAGNCIVSNLSKNAFHPGLVVPSDDAIDNLAKCAYTCVFIWGYQIYTPAGSAIWYGRVTPHDVDSIVMNTIINGLVLPPLLRGGLNLSRPNCSTLNDW